MLVTIKSQNVQQLWPPHTVMCCDVLAYTERTVVYAMLHGTLPVAYTVHCLCTCNTQCLSLIYRHIDIWAYRHSARTYPHKRVPSYTTVLGTIQHAVALCVSMFGDVLPSKEAECHTTVLVSPVVGDCLPTPESLHAPCRMAPVMLSMLLIPAVYTLLLFT